MARTPLPRVHRFGGHQREPTPRQRVSQSDPRIVDHERVDVYRRALDFVVAANAIRECWPNGRGALANQLDRAAASIPLNIAEGAGEFAGREKARFYRIARRSATERTTAVQIRQSEERARRRATATERHDWIQRT